eukprot:TRINITY_DN32480_c0_g1_i1.p1 TRINITY_DN32480_c0_g1~~TRINITY_DN32480_c0_g1_i1.p1  ORF type:complete len:544 (+),score=108.35 TRINITY_DN32480_c0_g1_i1:59-1690(+)
MAPLDDNRPPHLDCVVPFGERLAVPGHVHDIDVCSSRSNSPRGRNRRRSPHSGSPRCSPGKEYDANRKNSDEQVYSPLPVLEKLEQLRKSPQDEQNEMRQQAMQGKSLKVRRSSKSGHAEALKAEGATFKLFCYNILSNSNFDAAIGVIIFLNSISIGLESTAELNNWDLTVFRVLEHVFLLIYTLELSLRFYVQGCSCLQSGWVRFDLALVGMGILTSWVVDPIVEILLLTSSNSIANPKEIFAPLMVLRVLRLFRLVRAVRLLVQFKTLWMLVRGLLSSSSTILYTFLLVLLMLYITACLAVELITKPHRDTEDEVMAKLIDEYWSDIPKIMLTLVQFVTFDSIGSIYGPMVSRDPLLLILFMPFILVVSISLMNLVTAVIVEGAIEQGKQDRDVQAEYKKQQIQAMVPGLTAMFHELDDDGSGTLTVDELTNCDDELREELMKYMNAESLVELFEMIDIDGSGEVNIEEFCEGISKLASSEQPVEFVRILKQLSSVKQKQARQEEFMKEQFESISTAQERMEQRLMRIEQAISRISSPSS